ncbi:magnesium protoporphyrin IX methyltransferase [Roseomonas fluvialis]|uniref:Magnesium protoporphyrin IX methyltransferase n=1 Tax=Roseomonas fluvialis TaxID=1750527 RepID=A0ABN6P3U0_9PROT|nr:magnesium protoporphyrin IX methyltransferase [Roseomonas fluvialis]BDG72274.1 magnesium protoporphyrin IX methyltransferase [Roseomonas fluvialis]
MTSGTWQARRTQIETYFDRTASETWKRLTSDAPVSGIRATVRAGRDAMRATLLSWLPADMRGLRLLDAGCGTGALSVEAAKRGASVVAIDVSRSLVQVARERAAGTPGEIRFEVGDMLDPYLGDFDHVVAMDSLIHYRAPDAVRALSGLAARTRGSILFTFAPRTPLLAAMHTVGRIFPRGDRAPAIEPVAEAALRRLIERDPGLAGFAPRHSKRIASGFYTSQAMELLKR